MARCCVRPDNRCARIVFVSGGMRIMKWDTLTVQGDTTTITLIRTTMKRSMSICTQTMYPSTATGRKVTITIMIHPVIMVIMMKVMVMYTLTTTTRSRAMYRIANSLPSASPVVSFPVLQHWLYC